MRARPVQPVRHVQLGATQYGRRSVRRSADGLAVSEGCAAVDHHMRGARVDSVGWWWYIRSVSETTSDGRLYMDLDLQVSCLIREVQQSQFPQLACTRTCHSKHYRSHVIVKCGASHLANFYWVRSEACFLLPELLKTLRRAAGQHRRRARDRRSCRRSHPSRRPAAFCTGGSRWRTQASGTQV